MLYHRLLITAALFALMAAPSLAQSVTLGNGGITVSVGDPRYPVYYPNQGQYPPPAYYPQYQYYPQQQANCCQHHYTYRDGHCRDDGRRYRNNNYYYGQQGRRHHKNRGRGRGNCRR